MKDKLTKSDIYEMEKEIEHRKLVVRKQALEDVKEARAHGDLSENFEYKAAKKFKNENESRIRYLERMIKTAVIIEDDTKEGQAGLNSVIKVYFIEDDEEETYKLVTTIRGNSLKNLISIDSPIGKALLGHSAGETVSVKVSDDYSFELKILEVTQGEDDEKIRKF